LPLLISNLNNMIKFTHCLFLAGIVLFSSCKKSESPVEPVEQTNNNLFGVVYPSWPEGFESGTKTSYTSANVVLTTGSWNLNDALIGTSTSDRKSGTKSARIQNTGMLTMNFNLTNGAASVSVSHAVYGTDASSTWGLWFSTNSGTSWTQSGTNITTSSTSLTTANFTLSVTGNVRFQLRKLSGGRLNIDGFSVSDNVVNASTRDDNMALGNPSNAIANVGSPDNYLMVKTQFALAYQNSRGSAKWVSWHLSSAWKGTATRCDCFTQDGTLPIGFFRATTSNYTNTGFDRGHMCPSDDRDGSSTDNAVTFQMTNIIPQAPRNNQITWANFEAYCRTLVTAGNELYIISGSYGNGGTGSLGGTTNTIASGSIAVPSNVWKVAVILPVGTNDLSRITTSTRVIAINTPNVQTVTNQTWGFYRTSVDAIETATGLDLLSNITDAVENTLEASVDNGPTN
jgi:endonuclease G